VTVSVLDENDNPPQFVYDHEVNDLIKDQYLVAIPDSVPVGELIFQIKVLKSSSFLTRVVMEAFFLVQATDADAGRYGEIRYRLEGPSGVLQHFSMDATTGEVRTRATFEDIDASRLPFELIVVATDNGGEEKNSNSQKTMLVVSHFLLYGIRLGSCVCH
jgi:hypothetical protein